MIEVLGIDGLIHFISPMYIKQVIEVTVDTCDIEMTESITLQVDESQADVIVKIKNIFSFYTPPTPPTP